MNTVLTLAATESQAQEIKRHPNISKLVEPMLIKASWKARVILRHEAAHDIMHESRSVVCIQSAHGSCVRACGSQVA
eukprot:1646696-Pleurochrysis_carterae.AAC.2